LDSAFKLQQNIQSGLLVVVVIAPLPIMR